MERRAEVVVIGGGSTGSSILYHLARRGATDSLLIEGGSQIAAGQTSRSTALVRTHYTVEVVARMARLSQSFFERFAEELPGRDAGYVQTGLLIGSDERTARDLEATVAMLRRLGVTSSMVDRDEASRLEPELDTSAFAGIAYEPGSGYAEPSTTSSSFASAACALGARVQLATTVRRIERTSAGLTIATSAGDVLAKKAVLATGVWSGKLLQGLGVHAPISCARHPVAIFRRPEEFSGKRPVVFDFVRAAYHKPEGTHLLFTGSLEPELDREEGSVDPDGYDEGVTFEEVARFSEWGSRAYPIMRERGRFERGYAGLYDNTPDQQPIIDELTDYGLEGVHCLVGLSGHGFKLCPEFGRIMASLVMDGRFPDYDVSAFRLGRFKEGRLMRGRYPVSTIG